MSQENKANATESTEPVKKTWKDRIPTLIAITTLFLAVCATLASFKAGGYSTKMVLAQNQSSDQWAYYQAKSIKANLYQIQRERLQLEFDTLPADAAASKRSAYQAKLDEYSSKIKKYDSEKEQIQQAAHDLEAKRDDAQRHGHPMGVAVIFLQIAILLSSVAGLFKRRELWFCALPLGALGMVFFANGFWLFLP